jgi:hypothetical protein
VIVISGGLVLVAIALLIGGLASSGLGLVWASIGVSLLSAVFLAVGVYQRRNEVPSSELPAESAALTTSDDMSGVRTVSAALGEEPAEVDDLGDEAVAAGGTVYVVVGRPRYHVEGCRYLAGKDFEERDVSAALDEGFSPCGVCKPDAALATLGATYGDETDASQAPAPAAEETSVISSIVEEEPAPASRAKKTAAKAPAKKAAAKTARAVPMVIAVPDRGKFHRSECRFAGSAGAEEMPKATAKRQGLVACGVCKP